MLSHKPKLKSSGPSLKTGLSGQVGLVNIVFLVAIFFILGLQFHLQLIQKINWDEFFYLSHIYEAQSGRGDKVFQMGHVYLFGWLTKVPGGEMVQITIARIVISFVQLGTLIFLFLTVRKFLSLSAALFSVLCFLGFGFVYIHGTSFRTDPLAALCMSFAIYIFAASDLKKKDLIGLSIALALGAMITIKVILFAPLLAVLAIWRLVSAENRKSVFLKFAASAFGAITLFVLMMMFHTSNLQISEETNSVGGLSSTFDMMFLSSGLFPRLAIMKVGFFTGLVSTLCLLGGLCLAIANLRSSKSRHPAFIILMMGLPLLAFIFYRNAYPYFFAFILPPACILGGYAFERMEQSRLFGIIAAFLISMNIIWLYAGRQDGVREAQSQTLAAIHNMFPTPVHYFDRNGMVASFPKAGLFMSSWGLLNYQTGNEDVFLDEMKSKPVPLLIDNSPALSAALRGEATALSETDAKALRENYIHHWGHIWVAGKEVAISTDAVFTEVLIPGVYTLESSGPIKVNNMEYNSGDIVELSYGRVELKSSAPQNIILKWGENLVVPDSPEPHRPVFTAF